jgi:hypothetical protein
MGEDRTEELAARLGIAPRTLAVLVASGWRRVEGIHPPDPWDEETDGGDTFATLVAQTAHHGLLDEAFRAEWFVAGEPEQLMLGLGPSGMPLLARPQTRWEGHVPALVPLDVHGAPELRGCPDDAGSAAEGVRQVRAEVMRRSRARLRYCQVCLAQVRLEHLIGQRCHPCLERWDGLVF